VCLAANMKSRSCSDEEMRTVTEQTKSTHILQLWEEDFGRGVGQAAKEHCGFKVFFHLHELLDLGFIHIVVHQSSSAPCPGLHG